jgi:hypothetical protein
MGSLLLGIVFIVGGLALAVFLGIFLGKGKANN